MNSALPSPSQPPRPRVHAQDGIEWEELPSLRDRVIPEGWADTMPASLEALLPSPWLRDLLPGLDVHEIDEPEIFRVYFEKRA